MVRLVRATFLVSVLAACGSSTTTPSSATCDVDVLAANWSGSAAVDCGHILKQDPRPIWTCAVDAFRANRPFRVREDTQGIDSTISNVTTRRADGGMVVFSSDGDPSGGSGAPPHVTVITCGTASVVTGTDGIERVSCANASGSTNACH